MSDDITLKIDVNNLSVRLLQDLLLLFLDKRDDLAKKNKEFYNLSTKKILVTINGMQNQLFSAGLQDYRLEILIQSQRSIFTKKTLM